MRNEIDRLNNSNKDLEKEKNTIKNNLKQILETQMQETIEFLGINNTNNKLQSNNSTINNQPDERLLLENSKIQNKQINALFDNDTNFQINKIVKSLKTPIELTSQKIELNSNNFEILESNNIINNIDILTINPLINNNNNSNNKSNQNLEFSDSEAFKNSEDDLQVKDKFILNQIDLINKYYQIDNSTITDVLNVKKTLFSNDLNENKVSTNENNSSSNINTQNLKLNSSSSSSLSLSALKGFDKNDINNNSNSFNQERKNGLRHFIEKLLNKSPSSSNCNINENMNNSYSEIDFKNSTIENLKVKSVSALNIDNLNMEIQPFESKLNSNKINEIDVPNSFNHENYLENKFNKLDLSDVELGYNRRYPIEYYDDVKRVLNFDDDDDNEFNFQNCNNSKTDIYLSSSIKDSVQPFGKKTFDKKLMNQKPIQSKSLNSSLSISLNSIDSNKIYRNKHVNKNESQNKDIISVDLSNSNFSEKSKGKFKIQNNQSDYKLKRIKKFS